MNVIHLLLSVWVITLLSACEKKAFFDAGEPSVKQFHVDTFYVLEVDDIFEIELQNAEENMVVAYGGANLLENLHFYNEGDRLHLTNTNKFDWSRKYNKIKLVVKTTDLTKINIRIPCKIITRTPFVSDQLRIVDWEKFSEVDIEVDVNEMGMFVSSDNAGIYTIRGKAGHARFRPWGSCFMYAHELIAKTARVTHSSIGDCYVNASDKLEIEIDENGTIYYAGKPELIINKNTAGRIMQLP